MSPQETVAAAHAQLEEQARRAQEAAREAQEAAERAEWLRLAALAERR